MKKPILGCVGALLVLPLIVTRPGTVEAQATPRPAEILEALASGDGDRASFASVTGYAAFERRRDDYTDEDRRELLAGIERTAGASETPRRSRPTAFSILRMLAQDSIRGTEDGQIAPILMRIHRQTESWLAKLAAIRALASVPEDGEVTSFLEAIARKPAAEAEPNEVERAIEVLARRGDAVAVLRRLHEEGAVKDRDGAAYLTRLSKNGFTLPSKN